MNTPFSIKLKIHSEIMEVLNFIMTGDIRSGKLEWRPEELNLRFIWFPLLIDLILSSNQS